MDCGMLILPRAASAPILKSTKERVVLRWQNTYKPAHAISLYWRPLQLFNMSFSHIQNTRRYFAQEDCGSIDLDDDGSDDDFQEPERVEEWERRLNAIDCPEEEEIDSETDEYEGLNRR